MLLGTRTTTDEDDDHLISMAGPHLEVFKFGVRPCLRDPLQELMRIAQLYVFFPIAIMIHYGDPDWYAKHVLPYKDAFVRADLPQVVRQAFFPPQRRSSSRRRNRRGRRASSRKGWRR